MSLFYRFVASSMVTDFSVPEAGKLTPYSAIFFFAIGVLVSNFLFNYIIMKKPFEGAPLSFTDYLREELEYTLPGFLEGLSGTSGCR